MNAAYNAVGDHQFWLTSNHVTWQEVMSKLKGRVLTHPTSTLEAPTNECNRFFSYRYFVQSLFFIAVIIVNRKIIRCHNRYCFLIHALCQSASFPLSHLNIIRHKQLLYGVLFWQTEFVPHLTVSGNLSELSGR